MTKIEPMLVVNFEILVVDAKFCVDPDELGELGQRDAIGERGVHPVRHFGQFFPDTGFDPALCLFESAQIVKGDLNAQSEFRIKGAHGFN